MDEIVPFLIAPVAVNLRRILKRKELAKEAGRLLGETKEDRKLLDEADGPPKRLKCDDAVFFYPGLPSGIPLSGPINPREMCETFFHENVQSLFPETSLDDVDIADVTDLAIKEGMVAVFGINGRLNQFLAKSSVRILRSSDDLEIIKQVFNEVSDELVWLTSYNGVATKRISSKDALGTNLLNWKQA